VTPAPPGTARSGKGRLLALAVVALVPASAKPLLYRRLFGYRIGQRVRIGCTLLDARECEIGDDVVIGHGNVVTRVGRLVIGDHVRIGQLNVIRGGDEVVLDRYVEILRLNELNSIPEADSVNPTDPRLHVGAGTVIAAGHKIDFTDRVTIGRRTILAGRHSSLWTHNRQRTAPIEVGELAYIGSESRMAPGAKVPSRCLVGLGAVVVDDLGEGGQLFGGVPARAIRPLTDDDIVLIERKTRDDLPDDV
jgi:acetyltransferase-like isoleucine patch superfamily enzyme